MANAYRILRERLRVRPPDSRWRPCPRCGQFSDILVGLDGRKSCPNCLLGVAQRNRILPMPFIPFAKHLASLTLYGACVYFLFVCLESGTMRHAAISLACVLTGLLVLAAEVIWLVRDESKVREMRLNDPRRTRRRPAGRRASRDVRKFDARQCLPYLRASIAALFAELVMPLFPASGRKSVYATVTRAQT